MKFFDFYSKTNKKTKFYKKKLGKNGYEIIIFFIVFVIIYVL